MQLYKKDGGVRWGGETSQQRKMKALGYRAFSTQVHYTCQVFTDIIFETTYGGKTITVAMKNNRAHVRVPQAQHDRVLLTV
jgi:hypothetical protein